MQKTIKLLIPNFLLNKIDNLLNFLMTNFMKSLRCSDFFDAEIQKGVPP